VSVCRGCGGDVTWARKEESGWRPPLDYLGQALTIRGGAVVEVPIYRQHECDEARVAQWRAEQDEQARLIEQYARDRAEAQEIGLKRDCLKCGARPGEACINLLVMARREQRQDTRWPHAERMAADPEPVEEVGAP
jgi:hypothetical protein